MRHEYKLLSVIVPVYNERNTIGEVVRRLRTLQLPAHLELEVLVVDDGSTDGTSKVLGVVEDSTVRVIHHDTNRGKGAAIRTGINESSGDIVLFHDADLEYDPSDVPRLIEPIISGRARVAYGSRFHAEREAMTLTSVLGDRFLSVATCLLFNTTLTDVESGLEAFDRELLSLITIEADNFDFQPELTAKILRQNQAIFEVPVSYQRRRAGDQKFRKSDRISAFRTLLRLRFKRLSSF